MYSRARSVSAVFRVRWLEALGLMTAAVAVPFLVHVMPWSGPKPAGVSLMPVFWTAFVAVFLETTLTALLVALATSVGNMLITGHPAVDWLGSMNLELLAYVLVAAFLVRRWPRFWGAAPLAYLPAKALVIGLQWMIPAMHETRPPLEHFVTAVTNGRLGLAVLLVINLVLVRLAAPSADWDSD